MLIVRILLAGALFAFLLWALATIYNEMRTRMTILQTRKTPAITLAITNTLEDQTASFTTPEVIIGRSMACNFIVNNETVSSQHARLTYHHEQWWVEDMGSTNGTFINEERVTMPAVVMNEDDLRCGQVNIQLLIEESQHKKLRSGKENNHADC